MHLIRHPLRNLDCLLTRRRTLRHDESTRKGLASELLPSSKRFAYESSFNRYNIVSDEDLKEAARKHLAYLNRQDASPTERVEKGHLVPLRAAQNE